MKMEPNATGKELSAMQRTPVENEVGKKVAATDEMGNESSLITIDPRSGSSLSRTLQWV